MASLDLYGVRPHLQSGHVGTLLFHRALHLLKARGFSAVVVIPAMNGQASTDQLALLRRLGYGADVQVVALRRSGS